MILDEIAERTRLRVMAEKDIISMGVMTSAAEELSANTGFVFKKALSEPGISVICELKKASPSRGTISKEYPYVELARDYEKLGASAISVLTEPYYFGGNGQHLRRITSEVKIPVLRKDFIIDEYQIYEAKVLGASAVLLICALLDRDTIVRYIEIAKSLGISAIVEAHSEEEVITAVDSDAEIIGINNRDLKTFRVDIGTSTRLREFVPRDRVFVSESGISNSEDIRKLREVGVDAILVGEALMLSSNRKSMMDMLRSDFSD
jgi:indole-3-glycerol phosphate synthase